MSTDFDISNILTQIGSSVTITEVDSSTINTRGDVTESETSHTGSTAEVQMMDATDEEVKEGIVNVGDVIAFFDADDTNASYLSNGNKITYDSVTYKIYNVIPPMGKGHYEVYASKES